VGVVADYVALFFVHCIALNFCSKNNFVILVETRQLQNLFYKYSSFFTNLILRIGTMRGAMIELFQGPHPSIVVNQ